MPVMKKLLPASILALGALLSGTSHAARVPTAYTLDFDNLAVGTYNYDVYTPIGHGFKAHIQNVVPEADGVGNAVQGTGMYFTGPDSNISGFDIAVTSPKLINGQQALGYVVKIEAMLGNKWFAAQWLAPAPDGTGTNTIHISPTSIGGDWGYPYGEVRPFNWSISVGACVVCGDSNNGSFYNVSQGSFIGGWYTEENYVYTDFSIDNLSVISYAPVPEPSTYAMMLAGLAGLIGVQRRRQTRKQASLS